MILKLTKQTKKTKLRPKIYFFFPILCLSTFFLFLKWNQNKNHLKLQMKKTAPPNILKRTEKMSGPFSVWIEKENLSDSLPMESTETVPFEQSKPSNSDPNSQPQEVFLLKGNFKRLNPQVQEVHFQWILSPNFEVISGLKKGELYEFEEPSKTNTISLKIKAIHPLKETNQNPSEVSTNEHQNHSAIFLILKDPKLSLQHTASIRLSN